MKRLAVFTEDPKFLGFTRRFESRVYGRIESKGLRFVLERMLLPFRIQSISRWADYVFVDFLTPMGQRITKFSTKPVYLRIHRFELDFPHLFEDVNWDNVATVIAVSNHYGKLLREFVPKHVPIDVVYTGADAKRWPFHPCNTGRLCTWAIPTPRKRIYDLMLTLRNETLYVGGYSANNRILKDINERFALGHSLEPDIKFPEWLWDKEFYIHHALDESFGVAICEAMLAGLVPLVHRLQCVLEFLPQEFTYIYDSELLDLIEKYRAMSDDDRLALKKQLRSIVLNGFTAEQTGERMQLLFEKRSI